MHAILEVEAVANTVGVVHKLPLQEEVGRHSMAKDNLNKSKETKPTTTSALKSPLLDHTS